MRHALHRDAVCLLAAFCAHNIEEALTYQAYRDRAGAVLVSIVGQPIDAPSAYAFRTALAVVSLAALALTLWVVSRPPAPGPQRAVRGFAAILLANVMVPHVPAALLFGGYAPGVGTALAINLPLAVFVLRRRDNNRKQVAGVDVDG